MPDPELEPDEAAALERLTDQLAQIGFALPGSVIERMMRCGKASCACKADPPRLHGPYIQWTRKVAGKTLTRNLTAEQYDRYTPWFDNARRLRELTTELETLSLRTAQRAEDWPPDS